MVCVAHVCVYTALRYAVLLGGPRVCVCVTDWGWSGHPSLPFKSHKTLNLTTADSTLVGRPEHYINVSQDPAATAATPTAKALANGLPYNVSSLRMLRGWGGQEDLMKAFGRKVVVFFFFFFK